MKTFLVIMLVSVNAFATKPGPKRVTCATIQAQAEKDCEESICEQAEADGVECVQDGEYAEVFQECVEQEVSFALKAYNSTQPKTRKLVCE